jgi:hypothetical protein
LLAFDQPLDALATGKMLASISETGTAEFMFFLWALADLLSLRPSSKKGRVEFFIIF